MLDGCVTVSWLAAFQPVTFLLCEIAQLIWSEKQPGGGNLLKPAALTFWLSFSAWEAGTSQWEGQTVPWKGLLRELPNRQQPLRQ